MNTRFLGHLPALVTLLAVCLFPDPVRAQAPAIDKARLDTIMEEALRAWECPGAAIVVVRGDEVVYVKGFGVQELGRSQPVTIDTLFAIASTSKAFTCLAIAMLVMDGKMRWDDPVSKHLDYFHLADPLADRNVTIRDLVTHRTGLSRNDLLWLASPWGREEIVRRIGHVKLSQPFRSTYQYQNIMYLTAGVAAGKASGSSWEEFTRTRIFAPLGMKGANFSVVDAIKSKDHATPHSKGSNGKVAAIPWRNIDNIGPAGSINASVRDLGQWIRFQLGDGTFEGKRLLTRELLQETHSPQMVIPMDGSTGVAAFTRAMNPETTMMCYGLGWVIQDYRGQLMISHGGSIDGFRAQVALLPRQRVGMAILSNLGRTSLPEAVRNRVVDHVLGVPDKDWNAYLLAQLEKAAAAERKRELDFEAKQQKNTKPSRDLSAYVGTYDDPAYGPLTITEEKGTLFLHWSSFKLRLEHFHFDTFRTRGDPLVHNRPVLFTFGADGNVEKLVFLDQEFRRRDSLKR